MAITSLNPYLNFDGTAEQAITFYQRALDARCEAIMRFGDFPEVGASLEAKAGETPAEVKKRVLHAQLFLGGGTVMISDCPPGMQVPAQTNCHVNLQFDDVDDLRRKFDALSAGGTVIMPVQDMFWGATFGMLRDRFGISWMLNCEHKPA